ncbi:hypothetical protein QTJ16_006484 [Diplocarpon rosae]|uniref:Hemerythrin-like domain-containing protein n=1 Tax=Diplocarpon rosae TaxID=946125 RepID=A0AAD9SX44_9HELO|nr:hypothetical protein QTJ16_006484 [Diplocarpon rosae]
MLVSQAIGQDHRYLDECHDKLKAAPTTEEQIKWRNMLVWNLARHAISEELIVYPAMVQHLGAKGKELTETDFQQHQAVKEDLHKLQSMSPTDPAFSHLLEQLMHDLHTHIAHEKDVDMPALEGAISEEESARIARSFVRTKQIVPTKPHPDAPTGSPLQEGLAGLLAAPIDKLRTLMESFPEEETGGVEVDWSDL